MYLEFGALKRIRRSVPDTLLCPSFPRMSSNNQALLPTINDPKVLLSVPSATAARGAKRTTKAAQKVSHPSGGSTVLTLLTCCKLQVLPDTPEPVTQSQVLDDARLALDHDEPDAELLPQETSPGEDDIEVILCTLAGWEIHSHNIDYRCISR